MLSVGNKNKERIIKHVAAGKVDAGSTDAVNGGQTYSVIDVFGKLGFDVLGAVKNMIKLGSKHRRLQVYMTKMGTISKSLLQKPLKRL